MKLNVLTILASAFLLAVEAWTAPIDFNRDVRPILSDACYHCHGPDAKNQKSDFRLDTEAKLFADLGGYFGVKAGSLKDSELHHRIRATDPDDIMPPPKSNRKLSAAQKDILDAWIEQGATWDQHWAFKSPVRPTLPKSKTPWGQNAIDRLVLAKLEKESMKPAAAAEWETLLRRAALAATGLPPTPEQMEAFLETPNRETYAREVKRLLNTMDYAERQTLRWLDAARYADTDGYQNDGGRSNWPWRDWVIQAFHDNMPFDQFTIEQIAGDMLPDATSSQVLASAFNRNHRQNSEGGALAEEFFVENVIDRVETTSVVWLGLTVGCARCHDHKYDPLSQREFYQLFAYFNNIGENGTGKGTTANPIQKMRSPLSKPSPKLAAEIATAEQALQASQEGLAQRLETWVAAYDVKKADADSWKIADITQASSTTGKLEKQEDSSWKLTGKAKQKATYTLQIKAGSPRVTGIRLDALPDPSFTKPRQLARSSNGNFVLSEVVVLLDGKAQALKPATATFAQDKYPASNLTDGMPGTGWAIYDKKPYPVSAFILLAQPLELNDASTLTVELRHQSQFADHNIGRFMLMTTQSDTPDLKGSAAVSLEVIAAIKLPKEQRSKKQQELLLNHYRSIDGPLLSAKAEQTRLENEMGKQGFKEVPVMVMRERPGTRMPAYLLNRGQYTEPDKSEELPRGVPAALFNGPSETMPQDRLELARWLVSRDHPLTARVFVNRVWQGIFGTGLVKTVEDFGAQGEVPPNPELLDWLAVEFIESGWDLKALYTLIFTSDTFQQSSKVTAAMLERDPENRFLARGPRHRMDGFSIRDSALQAAGLLNSKPGGPPVKPYQPTGLWNVVGSNANTRYGGSKGPDLYRKSMYTYWKRAVNPPRQIIFDAAGRETCNVNKRVTNTPLQALVLMNDVTFVEAARNLAQRALKDGPSTARGRLNRIYSLATARKADSKTLEILTDSLMYYQPYFKAQPEEAKAFLAAGASPRDESLDPAEHAAYTAVAHLVLNLDECITLE